MSESLNTARSVATTTPRGLRFVLLSMLVAASATVALSAWAGPGHGGRHGGPDTMMFGGGRGVDRMLDGLNATDAQRSQIKQIMEAARTELKPTREQHRALREKSLQIFTAPTVDAAQAESVRQQMQQLHDTSSRRMLQAMLDASRVLTPEQRAKLGERMKQRGDAMRERMQRMERERPARP
jgi:protein CpxP